MRVSWRAALELAIGKWRAIVKRLEAGKRIDSDGGYTTCALCQLYRDDHCKNCPVRLKTGWRYCAGTPFAIFEGAKRSKPKLAAVKVELIFLIGLRPSVPRKVRSGKGRGVKKGVDSD